MLAEIIVFQGYIDDRKISMLARFHEDVFSYAETTNIHLKIPLTNDKDHGKDKRKKNEENE